MWIKELKLNVKATLKNKKNILIMFQCREIFLMRYEKPKTFKEKNINKFDCP